MTVVSLRECDVFLSVRPGSSLQDTEMAFLSGFRE